MRYAWSVRHARLVDAHEPTSYTDYLNLGLRCPREGCKARVFFVAEGKRKSHPRKLRSGKIVEVKESELINPHFSCFNASDCKGNCQQREQNLSAKELRRVETKGRQQNYQRLQLHLISMFDITYKGSIDFDTERTLDDSYLQELISTKGIDKARSTYLINWGIDFLRDSREHSNLLIADVKETIAHFEEIIIQRTQDYNHCLAIGAQKREGKIIKSLMSLSEIAHEWELVLQKKVTEEIVEFLFQRRQEPVLISLMYRTLLLILVSSSKSKDVFGNQDPFKLPDQLAELLKTLSLLLVFTPWGLNWERLEKERASLLAGNAKSHGSS